MMFNQKRQNAYGSNYNSHGKDLLLIPPTRKGILFKTNFIFEFEEAPSGMEAKFISAGKLT